MSRNVFEKFIGTTQVNKTKVRKSLQTLQVSSDEKGFTGNNMVLPDNESVPSKKKLPVNKVIATEKENAPILRRSKRALASSKCMLNYAESPDDPNTSKSVSTKAKKNVLKPKKGRQTTLKKKNKREIDSNQTKINFSSVTSIFSDVSESAHTDKSILGTSAPSEATVTEDSGINLTNRDSTQSPIHSTQIPETVAIKQEIGIPDRDTSILTCVNPPLIYWEELAEQRRIALEKALHENELLHDQLTVLEAENSQLKQLLKEAENLAQVVRGIIQ